MVRKLALAVVLCTATAQFAIAGEIGTVIGRTSPDARVSVMLVLPSRDEAGAAAFVERVANPKDPLFRHFLRRGEYARRFGGDPVLYHRVVAWSHARGLQTGREYASHEVLRITGTAVAMEAAFKIQLLNYRDAQGNIFRRAMGTPSAPADIGSPIEAIIGFDESPKPRTLWRKLPANAKPTGAGTGPDGSFFAADLRSIYSIPAQPAGQSESIAIFEQGGYNPRDIVQYEKANNLPAVPIVCHSLDGTPCTIVNNPDIAVEAALDIDMAVGINPGLSHVDMYIEDNLSFPAGLLDAMSAIADDDVDQTASFSYGEDEFFTGVKADKAENKVLRQIVAQGQEVFASSGDNGVLGAVEDLAVGVLDPASQPLIVSVGGTTLFTGPGESWLNEVTWDEMGSRLLGSGGGVSQLWPIPNYQLKLSENPVLQGYNVFASTNYRNVPDAAAIGDPFTGVAVYSTVYGGWITVGGTSVGTPIWAGLASITDAVSRNADFGPLGFINPSLYLLPPFACYADFNKPLHDVLYGVNGDPNTDGTSLYYSAGPGYDNVTGMGTPIGTDLSINLVLAGICSKTDKALAAPTITSATSTPTTVTITWASVPGATAYLAQEDAFYAEVDSRLIGQTKTTFTGLTPHTSYGFVVQSINKDKGLGAVANAIVETK